MKRPMKKRLRNIDWCVIDYSTQPNVLRCKRCGGVHALAFPIPVDELTRLADAFMDLHLKCEPNKP